MRKLALKFTLLLIPIMLITACNELPVKKAYNNTIDASQFSPPPDKASLVFIRPYSFYFYGYPVDVLVNDEKLFSLPNQSYKKIVVNPGRLHIRGQSSLMGPASSDITLQADSGQTIYLTWGNSVTLPIGTYESGWFVTLKDLAIIHLKEVKAL